LAVGTFDTWQQLRSTLYDPSLRGLALDSFNCLALQRIFALSEQTVSIQELAFPNNSGMVCCTSGPLADHLAKRLRLGAPTLRDALCHWLVPRHAAHFEKTVEGGKILLWIRLTDDGEERRVCKGLLANSSDSVGVHDFH
jgi:hypothetical protein